MIITIDGPTASGKSTVAHMLADKYQMYHLNSGLLYRAMAYLIMTHVYQNKNAPVSVTYKDIETYGDPQRLMYVYEPIKGAQIFFDGIDITPLLKNANIDAAASIISTNAAVRAQVDTIQHYIARTQNVVIDGRDAGSVVFPHAQVKFFLTASLEARARRWQHMQEHKGFVYSIEQAKQKIIERDERDSARAIAPLIVPHDAITIDSTHLTLQQTVEKMETYIRQ